MAGPGLGSEISLDLLRSCWIVEAARASVYRGWAAGEERYSASADRSLRRAAILEAALDRAGIEPDHDLVAPHRDWMLSIVGTEPEGLAPLLLVRFADWVEAHVAILLEEGEDLVEIKDLGEAERAGVQFPGTLPDAPGFEPLDVPDVDPPGGVLFRFGILGDAHIGSPSAEPLVRAAIADLNASGAEIVIQLGDLTDEGSEDEFRRAREVLSELDMPHTTMMGNHDVVARRENRLAGRDFYTSHFGREPDGIMLEHKGFRFAVLDSAEHEASPFAPFDLVAGQFLEGPGGAVVRGSLSPSQHDLLADVAAAGGAPTFVFLHHPPQPYTGFPPVIFGLRDEDTGRLHATIDSGNVWGVFAGHTHRNARTRDFNGVPAHEVAVPRDFPFGYALVDVTADGYAYRFHQVSDEDLLREGYMKTSALHRRYAAGSPEERAFVWKR